MDWLNILLGKDYTHEPNYYTLSVQSLVKLGLVTTNYKDKKHLY
jgi:hypothetical protein